MNPHFHDEFVTLVPLFHSGELTDEEWALLQVHMAYCASCQESFEEYQQIASNVVPAMAASLAGDSADKPIESEHSLQEAEKRLMSRLDRKGSRTRTPEMHRRWAWLGAGALAACVAGIAVYVGMWSEKTPSAQKGMSSSAAVSAAPVSSSTASTDQAVPAGHDESVRDQQMIVAVQSQLAKAQRASTASQSALEAEKQVLRAEQNQEQQLVAERDALKQQLSAAQADTQDLHGKLAAASSAMGQGTARIAELETKVQRLDSALDDANASLDAKEKMLAFDRDLMLHDRDIRDVLGARDLYIADIYDTTANGATAKPFGRIFYTKDSSLVFYGFDLDKQTGIKQSAAFQVWGSGTGQRPVSLGLFYQDDGHRRWVLKCKDASTLARLNMVFVTIEPPGGSAKPTGKQFLRAYLQIQPNHP